MLRIASLALLLSAAACTTDEKPARELKWNVDPALALTGCNEVTIRTTFASGRTEINRDLFCDGSTLIQFDENDPPRHVSVTGFHVDQQEGCKILDEVCVNATTLVSGHVDITDDAVDGEALSIVLQ